MKAVGGRISSRGLLGSGSLSGNDSADRHAREVGSMRPLGYSRLDDLFSNARISQASTPNMASPSGH